MAALSPGQAKYWQSRLDATATNSDRAAALFDLARKQAGEDDALMADLVRLLRAWTEEQMRRAGP
jgi:hypothetical protein